MLIEAVFAEEDYLSHQTTRQGYVIREKLKYHNVISVVNYAIIFYILSRFCAMMKFCSEMKLDL